MEKNSEVEESEKTHTHRHKLQNQIHLTLSSQL